jgi:lambda repressor-like predicted transcriptional regulator
MINRKVKSLLILKGIKIKDIAEMAGVKPDTVSVVLGGYGTSQNVKETIAKALKMPFNELWPDNSNS